MTEIFVKYTTFMKNRTPTPVYLDPGMHSGLEVKGLKRISGYIEVFLWNGLFRKTCIKSVFIARSFTAKFVYYEPRFDPQKQILPSYYEF